MEYSTAIKIANRLVELLGPACERIDIAGSIRRMKADVKDVEIVCLPVKEFIQKDLFGGGEYKTVPAFNQAVQQVTKELIKGNTDGRYMQILLKGFGDFKLDVFMPQQHDYYRQLAIRTGSAQYAHHVIANGWLQKGWCGTELGLRLQKDCQETKQPDGKSKWYLLNENGELPPAWQSEDEFFTWLNIPYVYPRFREINDKNYQQFLRK